MFGASFSNNPQPSAGLFGQNQPKTGGLLGQPQQGTGFASSGPSIFAAPTTQPNAFGQPQQQQQGGLFGGQPQQSTGGIFGQPNQGTAPTQGGLFGQPSTGATGMFGNTQPAATGGIFGGGQPQQQPTQGGIFGQPAGGAGLFGAAGQQNSPFGGQQQQQQQGQGLFGQQNNAGTGMFGQTNPNSGGGMFGQNTGATGGNGTGLFGAATTNNNSSFFGNTQPTTFPGNNNPFGNNPNNQQNQGAGLFGAATGGNTGFGATAQQNNNLFGAPSTQPAGNAGGLFNTFAPSNPAPNNAFNSPFSSVPAPNTSAANPFNAGTNSFGTTGSVFGAGGNNKLGGTSWGVPVTAGTQQAPGGQMQPMQPVRSKNSKLDAKHLVKCIAVLDQFQGNCKEEIRINYIQNGGQQPAIAQQQQNNAGFKSVGAATGPLTSLPSFGGATNSLFGQTNPNPNPAQNTLFGGQNAGTSLFAKPATGFPQNNPGFGQQQQQNQSFGQPSTGFGNPPSAGGSLFGQAPQNPQGASTSLFGAPVQQPQQGQGLFGQAPSFGQQGSSLFAQPQKLADQPGFFGQAQGGSLFQPTGGLGQAPSQPGLFGQTGLQPPPSLFSTPAQQTSLFQPQAQPNISQALGNALTGFPNPNALAPNPYNQMQPQAQPQMDQAMQLLLPQLLVNYALNQPQNNNGDPNFNPTLDALNKLVSAMNVNRNNTAGAQTNNSNILKSTPFDEYLKEESESKWNSIQPQKYSLFSDAEIRQFQDLDSRSFSKNNQKYNDFNEQNFRLKHSYEPAARKPDPLGETNFRVVNRQYRATQDRAKSKYLPSAEELPTIGNFTIEPSLAELKRMTCPQLKKIPNLIVSNQYGSIEFLEPISVIRLDLTQAVKIAQDNIEIIDPELQEKKVRMNFYNFGQYTDLKNDQKGKLLKRMRVWISKCNMKELYHDEETGNLQVQTLD